MYMISKRGHVATIEAWKAWCAEFYKSCGVEDPPIDGFDRAVRVLELKDINETFALKIGVTDLQIKKRQWSRGPEFVIYD